jgi:fibronectin-binding autotransporter adhesin
MLLAIAFLTALPVSGQTYTVTSTADDGSVGTLPWAIEQADATSGSTIYININPASGPITLTSALPMITSVVTISGNPGVTISGNNQNRIFFVDTTSASAVVNIDNLNLIDGKAQGGAGGTGGGGGGLGAGGAIFVNSGAVTVSGVGFTNNSANGGAGGAYVGQFGGQQGGGGGGGLGGNGGFGGGGAYTDGGSSGGINSSSGGGGGGYAGNGGNSYSGTGGGGGVTGNGGNGDIYASGGGGGGGVTTGGNGNGDAGGTGGLNSTGTTTIGGAGAGTTQSGASGLAGGGGGGGGAYGGTSGGSGGEFGGGGGANSAESGKLSNGGNGGDFGGGGGVGYSSNLVASARAGNGGWGGGGGGGGEDSSALTPGYGGNGGFGGGGGGNPYFFGGSAANGGYLGGAGTNVIDPRNGGGGGGGGGAAGGAIFVRTSSDGGNGSLTIIDSSISPGSVTGGAGGDNAGAGTGAGSALFLDGGSTTIEVDSSQTIAGSIADASPGGHTAASLVVTGGGTLTLTGDNTYAGGTTLESSALKLGNNNALGTSTLITTDPTLVPTVIYQGGVTITNPIMMETDTTLEVDSSGSATQQGVISQSGGTYGVSKTGTGTLTLTGAETYGGLTTVSGGTLAIGAGGNIADSSGVDLTASGTTFDISNGGSQTIKDLSGVSGSTVNLGLNTLTVGTGNSTTFDGVIESAGGSLTKQGAGDLTLGGANTYGGLTTVSAGTLTFTGSTTGLGGNITDDAAVVFNQAANSSFSQVIRGNGTLTKQGAGNLTLGGANTYGGLTTVSGGTLTFTGSTTGLGGNITDDAAVVFNQAANSSFSQVISGNGTVTKQGAGTLTLTGADTYGGLTTVSGGTLAIGAGGNITDSSGVDLTASGTTFDISNGGSQTIKDLSGVSGSTVNLGLNTLTAGTANSTTFDGVIEGASGSLTKEGAGDLTLGGANTYGGLTTVSAGTLTFTGDTSGLGGTITDDAAVVFNQASDSSFSQAIGGNGTVTKQGAGNLTLGGANTYGGLTTVSAGTLTFTGSTTGLGGNITDDAAVVFNQAANSSFSQVISGNGTLTKQGVGNLTLGGADTYGGLTTVSAGTLTFTGDTSGLGGTITDNAAVVFNQATNSSFSQAVSGNGTVTKQGAGNLTLGGADTYGGLTTVSGGTLTFTGDTSRLGGNITDDAAVVFNQASDSSFSQAVSGNGTLTKQGAGNLTLGGANTYGGLTTLSGGTLTFTGSTTGLGGNITDDAAVVFNQATNSSFSQAIGGNGTVTKQGAGTLTLSGANTYIGATSISAGELNLTGSLTGSDVTTNLTGIFTEINTGSVAGSGVTFTQDSSGTSTLDGVNTYTGATTISLGTLQVDGSIASGSAVSVASGGALTGSGTINGTTGVTGGTIDGNGLTLTGLTTFSSGSSTLEGTETATAGIAITGSATVLQSSGTLTGSVTDTSSGASTFAGVIAGAGPVTLNNATGTLTLNGANTYTGATSINSGTLNFNTVGSNSTAQSLGEGTVVNLGVAGASSGILDYTGGTATLSGKTINVLGNGTVTTGLDTIANTGTGTLSLAGPIIKNGTNLGITGLINISGVISGTLPNSDMYYNNATSTITMSGTYTGPTHIFNTSTVTNGVDDALPDIDGGAAADSTLILGDAAEVGTQTNTYVLGGFTQTLGGLTSTTGSGADVNTVVGGSSVLSTLNLNISAGTDSYSGLLGNATGNNNNLAVVKSGEGTLAFLGANTYTGGTTINAGTLAIGNASGLGGGNVVLNGGTLTTTGGVVGDAGIQIQVGGNYTQGATGTLVLNLYGANNYDSLHLSSLGGVATVNGTLELNLVGGFAPGSGEKFALITTSNQVIGQFSAITTNLPSIGLQTDYTNDVTVLYQKAFTTLPGLNLTPNQTAVATYIDAHDLQTNLQNTNPGFSNLVAALNDLSGNPNQLGPAFDQLTSVKFAHFASSTAFNNASFSTAAFDTYLANHRGADGTFVSSAGGVDDSGLTVSDPNLDPGLQAVHSRLLAWNPAPSTGLLSDTPSMDISGVDLKNMVETTQPDKLWNVFLSGNVILSEDFSDPTAGLGHADTTTGAISVGADYKITSHFLIGAEFAYGHTYGTLDDIGSNASVDTYSPGVYASYSEGGWYANAIGSYGFADYDENRNVSISTFNGTAHSSPGGDQIVGDLDGGYDFHRGAWTFGPTLGVQYVHLDVDGFTETGLPGADLTVNQDEADSLRSSLGGRLTYAIRDGGIVFNPHLSASWQHEFMDQSRGITNQFSSLGAGSFVVQTPNPSRDSALIDVGLDAQINDALTVFTDYIVQAGQSNYFGQSVQAGFKIGF